MSALVTKNIIRPKDVTPTVVSKVLDFLNSANTADKIVNTITMFAGDRVLSFRIAQRILHERTELGGFKDLREISAIPGIGHKTFTAIVHALGKPRFATWGFWG